MTNSTRAVSQLLAAVLKESVGCQLSSNVAASCVQSVCFLEGLRKANGSLFNRLSGSEVIARAVQVTEKEGGPRVILSNEHANYFA